MLRVHFQNNLHWVLNTAEYKKVAKGPTNNPVNRPNIGNI